MPRRDLNGSRQPPHTTATIHHDGKPFHENGFDRTTDPSCGGGGGHGRQGSGFETFVMTGDMIIRTTSSHAKSELGRKSSFEKTKRSPQPSDRSVENITPESSPKHSRVTASPISSPKKKEPRPSRIPKPTGSPRHSRAARHHAETHDTIENLEQMNNNVIASSVFEDTSMHQMVGFSPPPQLYPETRIGLDIPPDDISSEDDNYKMDGLINLDDLPPPPDELLHDYVDKSEEMPQDFSRSPCAVQQIGMLSQTPPTEMDYSEQAEPDLTDGSPSNINSVCSKSAEKLGQKHPVLGVRNSKSHENYLEGRAKDVTMVSIDFEDDNFASSVDALHYKQSNTSLEQMNSDLQTFHSLENSPERKVTEKHSERVLVPTFINLEEPRSITRLKDGGRLREFGHHPDASGDHEPSTDYYDDTCEDGDIQYSEPEIQLVDTTTTLSTDSGMADLRGDSPCHSPSQTPPQEHSPHHHHNYHDASQSDAQDTHIPLSHTNSPEGLASHQEVGRTDSDDDSVYHQPIKDVDRPSAARLAKRLFNLDGFRKQDISRHLHKKNDFAQLVGEEYLKYFDFTGMTLDLALRRFLQALVLSGETQERERVLAHFSRRFMECNANCFNSEDACHTLTCAIMLLNTDLHGQNIGRKMTVGEFIENLADLNDGENFPREVLRQLYNNIKTEPLECEIGDETEEYDTLNGRAPASDQRYVGHNPFLDIPDPNKATEYKKGYVMRKCCVDPDGRRTPLGKRGWKMYYAVLKDMILYLHKDEHAAKKASVYDNMSNSIRVHHSLATRATDYTKKQFVFRVQTADWAQYLFQTSSDSKECQEWIDTINFVASSLSAPPLPGGVGSQRKFQRPLMPSSITKLNTREQLAHHEQKVLDLEQELHEHRLYPPEKNAKSRVIQEYIDKEAYLHFELKRFKTYCLLLQVKLASYPELEPSLVEVAIGEVEEPPSPPVSDSTDNPLGAATRRVKPVQRSMSDRDNLLHEYELETCV